MGSDDLHHKRKQRRAASLKRQRAKIAPYDRILIVCEGAKTEPNYLKEIRDTYRLNTANIEICGEECGSDPRSVVNYAIKKFREDSDYNRVYCVIDRDKHASFEAAMDKLSQTKLARDVHFTALVSAPCFEFWLLLHYKYTTHPFCAQGATSNCDLVVRELRKPGRIPDYRKGALHIFSLTKERLPTAIKNAKILKKHNHSAGTDNPTTDLHELVEYLINLKK